MTEFFMPMVPPTVTGQMHKVRVLPNGKPQFYDPDNVRAAKEKLVGELYRHRIMEPYHEGVRLIVKWCFPRGQHPDGTYRCTRPDTDNLQKIIKDMMTLVGFWLDDELVCSEIVEKFWAETPGIYIKIIPIMELHNGHP